MGVCFLQLFAKVESFVMELAKLAEEVSVVTNLDKPGLDFLEEARDGLSVVVEESKGAERNLHVMRNERLGHNVGDEREAMNGFGEPDEGIVC